MAAKVIFYAGLCLHRYSFYSELVTCLFLYISFKPTYIRFETYDKEEPPDMTFEEYTFFEEAMVYALYGADYESSEEISNMVT